MIRQNYGYQNILTAIEVLSRFAFTKKLKTKKGEEVSGDLDLVL